MHESVMSLRTFLVSERFPSDEAFLIDRQCPAIQSIRLAPLDGGAPASRLTLSGDISLRLSADTELTI